MPAVGKKYKGRLNFTEAMTEFCKINRKSNFKLKDTGNKMVRSCKTVGCPGKVVGNLTKNQYGKKPPYKGPITITESVKCRAGCRLPCGETTMTCGLCQEEVIKSKFISNICCQQRANSLCFSCMKNYFMKRPLHAEKWSENDSLLNRVVKVGNGPGEVWYRCPLGRCYWTFEDTFKYQGETMFLKDLVPIGFSRFAAVTDRKQFNRLYRLHKSLVKKHPEQNVAHTPSMEGRRTMRVFNASLRDVEGESPAIRNEGRIALVRVNHRAWTIVQARAYLHQHRLIETTDEDAISITSY